MSEVKGDGIIQAGDKVEFVVVHHQKTGKYSACSVVKIGYVMLFFLSLIKIYIQSTLSNPRLYNPRFSIIRA